jgi:flagellar FliJ protein
MRKFNFRLQKVLDYKETVEDMLLAELAAIQQSYEHEVARLLDMVALRDSFHDRMKRDLTCGDPDSIRIAYHYLQELSDRISAQEVIVKQLAIQKEKKTAEVIRASTDRKVLEKLKEYKVEE